MPDQRVKILWYLTAPDGPYPWEAAGRWETGFDHMRQLAATIDRLGFYGALLGTSSDDGLTTAAALAAETRTMRFLTAVYPGLVTPAKLAQIARTIDRFSGERLLFNVVNGNDAGVAGYGLHLDHDTRYDFSAEYWDAFQHVYQGELSAYRGKFTDIAARRNDDGPLSAWRHTFPGGKRAELWGAGTSPAGVAHAVNLFDVYLSFADTPQRLGEKFRRVGAEAAKLGRTLRYGTRLQVIVRETDEEAWDAAAKLLTRTSADTARGLTARQFPPGQDVDSYEPAPDADPRIARRLAALRAGRLPAVRDLEIHPNVWAGPSMFGFDVVHPGAGIYLVGSAENVAARIREYRAHGTEAFILSGFPLIAEAQRVADLLFPLLDLDHGFDVPVLREKSRGAEWDAGGKGAAGAASAADRTAATAGDGPPADAGFTLPAVV
ncbi:LLM class flavin-dependent oxidoreductase [Yinghuangia sp. ASG 101]|uniref:LLM class flavin-dependent oxidoreductase n=1 Tax=Yinghuangia sp. ASG 101 TaxID=2896848 RepID=UPI001E38920C|nr:LLM class flavin-dependent oxidoreductase [Yinghuangia sp. ASG 101]UGQ12109.1 LLM class flavin-dependent oxidoreductase [Yinghuangia sp. ASG 101]